MKLYLASYRLGEYPEKFKAVLESVTKNKKVALIINALDFTNNYFELTKSVQRDERDITSLGLLVEQIDLREYFQKPEKLKEKMQEFGSVYVRGGNVFILRRAFYESGFDKILMELSKKTDFLYAGFSAGACILSPTLTGLEYVDDPEIDPPEYQAGVRIFEGLGLIPFSIAPHFRSDHPESQKINTVVDYFLNNTVVFLALKDTDVIVTQTEAAV